MKLRERFVASPAGGWFFTRVAMRVDRVLMPLTKGRVRMSMEVPSGILICRGAKSGTERKVPLTFIPLDGDRIALIASNGGQVKHPAWYHNLRAHPDVRFITRGKERAYRTHLAEGPERTAVWDRALTVYGGYDTYAERAPREIGVFVLEPV